MTRAELIAKLLPPPGSRRLRISDGKVVFESARGVVTPLEDMHPSPYLTSRYDAEDSACIAIVGWSNFVGETPEGSSPDLCQQQIRLWRRFMEEK